MRWPWSKPEQKTVVMPSKAGFFSTDIQSPVERMKFIESALAKTFQIKLTDLKQINPDGTVCAMDEAMNTPSMKADFNQWGGVPDAQLGWYASQGFIGHQMCAVLAQNWLIDKACTMPARDAIRHGWEITSNDGTDIDPEVLDEIARQDKRYRLRHNCVQFVRMGRVFGIRVAMFKVDGIDYEAPFNPDGVKPNSYHGISQIDPYWIAPELSLPASSDPSAIDFFEPTWWRINGKRVHKSHLIIMRNGDVPDVLKPSYLYGGVPVPQRVFERVYAAERTANEAPMLAMTKRTTALTLDAEKALANQGEFESKMEVWANYRDNYGIKVLGENETLQQLDTALTDLDTVIMTQYQIVAAAAEVPATKLLGTSPKGFNATGEYEESSYHESLESIQEHDLTPLIERHHLLVIRSEIVPKFGGKPFTTSINWLPVDSPTAAELADINLKKAQTDSTLAQVGAIDGLDIRKRLIVDKDSGFNGMAEALPDMPEYENEDES